MTHAARPVARDGKLPGVLRTASSRRRPAVPDRAEHWETFRADAEQLRDGEGLPAFVQDEFRNFLRCGWLAGGFARFRCDGCGTERRVAFSCKGRGFCPSCGGRRMRYDACEVRSVRLRGRLAVLVPRPRVNLLFYHGVLGARSAWRRAIVPGVPGEASVSAPEVAAEPASTPRRRQWADLMRRSFGFDVLACDRCGGRLR